ncbi:MAG: phosphoglucosamine mutase [Helicobacteraceae bacterium]
MQKLFGTDGVRGRAGKKLTPFLSAKLAMAAGIYFRQNAKTNKILVGKDTRRSGYMIENAIVSGLTSIGFNVIQIGPMPTPAVAFLTESMRCDGGIMISASHNPYYDNGVKFFDDWGNKLGEEEEAKIEKIFENDALIEESFKQGAEIGSSKRIDDVIGRYIVHIKNSFPKHLNLNGLRVVLDTANGAAYKVAPTIFSELGAEVIVINDKPNGFNINEACGATAPAALTKAVVEYRADIGLAFDGDADRLVVVDEKGAVVDGDKLIAALAVFLKGQKKLKNDGCIITAMSNMACEEYLQAHKIKTFRSQVGDKFVVDLMNKNDFNFGGEQSGHIIFSDFAKTGDGLLSALQTVALVLSSKKPASVCLNPFVLTPQMQTSVMVEEKIPLGDYKGLQDELLACEKARIRHLVRYSGTENKLRILLEGKDKKSLKAHFDAICDIVKKVNG